MFALLANPHRSPGEAAIFFFLGFPAALFASSLALSRVSGWRRLARRYPAGSARPPGITCVSCTLKMGRILGPTYNRAIDVTLSASGVYIRPKILYRLFHPPLLLPWECVRSVAGRQFVFFRWLEVCCVAGGQSFKLRLPRAAAPVLNAEMAAAKRRH